MDLKIFTLDDDGNVVVTPEGMAVEEVRALIKSKSKNFKFVKEWLFFVHGSGSPYINYLPKERKQKVMQQFGMPDLDQEAEVTKVVALINKLTKLPKERFLDAWRKKYEELVEFWEKTKVTHKNFDKISNQLKGATGLVETESKLVSQVKEEKITRRRSGGESRLFETQIN